MPEPRAMNIAVYLDEVFSFNGGLMLVPRSHKQGTLKAGHDLETTSYPLWTLDQETVARLCRDAERDGKPGIVSPTGKPGSVLMFHGNLVHGSAPNITPYPRKIVYLTLNSVSNYIRTPTRPEFIAHRDFTPIRTLAHEILTFSTGPWETFWVLFYGFATYGNAGFMREQVCKYMCPYARFQSAMFDKDTLIITYDTERGEPRGLRADVRLGLVGAGERGRRGEAARGREKSEGKQKCAHGGLLPHVARSFLYPSDISALASPARSAAHSRAVHPRKRRKSRAICG